MPSDVFRPRLPLDPFGPQPWRVRLPPTDSPSQSHVVLVLGAPSHTDLAPLATSPHLSHSLLILATHTPPPLAPESIGPSIIILHLPEPLHVHDSVALNLASLLDRAQHVAHAWRTAVLPQPRIQQLAELYPGGEFSIIENPEFATPLHSPKLSSSPLSVETLDSDTFSTLSTSSSKSSRLSRSTPKTSKSHGQFTALINFLPSGLPDKPLLKHSILVTTLSAPFLVPPLRSSPFQLERDHKRLSRRSLFSFGYTHSTSRDNIKPAMRRRSRISSIFSSSPPSAYSYSDSSFSPSVEPPSLTGVKSSRPHVIHVLPYSASISRPNVSSRSSTSSSSSLSDQRHSRTTVELGTINSLTGKGRDRRLDPDHTRSKLVHTIEQFLLSFAYPPSASSSTSLALPSISPPPPSYPNQNGTTTRSSLSSIGALTSQRRSATTPNLVSVNSTLSGMNAYSGGSTAAFPNLGLCSAIPYLLPAGVLGTSPAGDNPDLSIGELIVLGTLDSVAVGGMGMGGVGVTGIKDVGIVGVVGSWPRAWISQKTDVEVVSSIVVTGVDTPQSEKFTTTVSLTDSPILGGAMLDEDSISPSRLSTVKSTKQARMNVSGLPTPPDSESSIDSGSARSHESGNSSENEQDAQVVSGAVHYLDGQLREVAAATSLGHGNQSRSQLGHESASLNGGEKRKLKTRMSSLFKKGTASCERETFGSLGRLGRMLRSAKM